MKYWEYPSHGIGSHSYTWNNQILSADFGATNYDWDNMTNCYGYYYDSDMTPQHLSDPSSIEIEAITTLMYHCGVSVNMKYGGSSAKGSSATTSHVVYALISYFNYSSDIVYRTKSDYEDEWITMVKAELDASRPLQYRGSTSGGHSFVCDGYDNNDYFHFNWGWSGAFDGYFSLDNLDTGANNQSGQGNGIYTNNQAAIFGIQPPQCLASEPTNLTYTMSNLQNLSLTWTATNGTSSYNIYRNNTLIGNSTTNFYTEVAPYGTDIYYVRSVDANGQLSLSSNLVTVTVAYPTPIVDDLEAYLSGDDINLTWSSPSWCYPSTPTATLTYGENNWYSTFGYHNGTCMYWGHRYPASDLSTYDNMYVYKVSFCAKEPGSYKVYIYEGTTSNHPQTLVLQQTITVCGTGWFDIDLSNTKQIDASQDLWVFMYDPEGKDYAGVYNSYSGSEGNYYSANPTSSVRTTSGKAFLIKTFVSDGTYTYNLYQDGTQIGQSLSQNSYNATLNNNAANLFSVKTNYFGDETDASNKIGFAKGNASLAALNLENDDKMTVTEGSQLTVSGTLSNENSANLILENGAQLIHNSENVQATVKKSIDAHGTDEGWYFIASPIAFPTTPLEIDGLLANNYDLYRFNENPFVDPSTGIGKEWENYKTHEDDFNIVDGQGYLYANSDDVTLMFTGTIHPCSQSINMTIDYHPDAQFAGWNLVGNPFTCNAIISDNGGNPRPYYVNNGKIMVATFNSTIEPCTGVMVMAVEENETITFAIDNNQLQQTSQLQMTVAQNNITRDGTSTDLVTMDNAIVSFDQGTKLEKFVFNTDLAKLYIPQDGKDYAIISTEAKGVIPVNFRAAEDGNYTLTINPEGVDMDYLHLIDNLTGNDVDLLSSPSYSFEAKTTDYASRFKLVFDNNNDPSTGSGTFAYINDGNIIINYEDDATLQIVDMTGRVVFEGDAMNRVSISGMTSGIYVLRLINGEKVQNQKIVIE